MVGIFYAIIDIYIKMKNLIRKILKEEQNTPSSIEDEFEWVRGLDVAAAEEEIQKPWKNTHNDYGIDSLEFYGELVDNGVHNPAALKELGKMFYKVVQQAQESGYDNGRDNCDCDCDGCCDDYYSWDYVQEEKESAEENGYDRGLDDGKAEKQSEIDELNERIAELESRLSASNDDVE